LLRFPFPRLLPTQFQTHLLTSPGFEQAPAHNFWDTSIADMRHKMTLFNAIWDELNIPYSEPEGGYFVMVNLSAVQIPADYPFPAHVEERARDFKLAWFLIQELGVAAIPPSEFYTDERAHIVEDYLRFAVCKPDDVLEDAKERLRGLKRFLK
jgi:kynurenine aminotransferase